MAKNKCASCGAPCIGEYCWRHTKYKGKRKPLKGGLPDDEQINKMQESAKQFNLFLEVWDDRRTVYEVAGTTVDVVNCFETGVYLPMGRFRMLTTCYHHVLEKSVYPQYRFNKKNIVILHPDVHELVHKDIDKCPKVKALREELLELHYKGEL